jgi:tryptophan synthase beta chain
MDLQHGIPLFVHGPGPLPDARGRFGEFGGRFVPETLIPALEELETAWRAAREDPGYRAELSSLLADYAGRPTPLFRADRLAKALGIRGRVYLKREDLLHTGAHKLNNTLGQGLLARRMGKQRFIAETGAGQHGVASATVAALLGLDCIVYMGAEDVQRQAPNVGRMKLLGAEVRPVEAGSRTLKDAMNEALRDWVTNVRGTYYCIGSAAGPHPYPLLVRELQKVIGEEIWLQLSAREGRPPDAVLACVGGGSNAIGAFHRFIDLPSVSLFGVEAGGHGVDSGKHGASLGRGRPGVLHGSLSYLLQDSDGQVSEAHSISAGLDYPGVGPELSYLFKSGRLSPLNATDTEALAGFSLLAKSEGILCALESAHAIAALSKLPAALREDPESVIAVNLSGRGDKDLSTILNRLLPGDPKPASPGQAGGAK